MNTTNKDFAATLIEKVDAIHDQLAGIREKLGGSFIPLKGVSEAPAPVNDARIAQASGGRKAERLERVQDLLSRRLADSILIGDWLCVVDACLARWEDLNEWQRKFLPDVKRKLESGKKLTAAQCDKVIEAAEQVQVLSAKETSLSHIGWAAMERSETSKPNTE